MWHSFTYKELRLSQAFPATTVFNSDAEISDCTSKSFKERNSLDRGGHATWMAVKNFLVSERILHF